MRDAGRIPVAAAIERADRAARTLSSDPRVRLVFVFGSTVDPPVDGQVGDIDLAVLTDAPLGLNELMRVRAEVVRQAGPGIDLVSLNDASVVLGREIVDGGRCLYARTSEIETEFVTRARARYWDFKPFLDVQWHYAGERIKARRDRQA
jgi:predicted nucleotidyltransferase